MLSLGGLTLDTWNSAEKGAFRFAMSLYASVCGVSFQEVGNAKDADVVWWLTDADDTTLAIHEPPSPGQRWGIFNTSKTSSWGHFASARTGSTRLFTNSAMGSAWRILMTAVRRATRRGFRASASRTISGRGA